MSTNFYERQSQARKSTSWLVWLFLLGVVLIVGMVFALAAFATEALDDSYDAQFTRTNDPIARWSVPAGAALAALTLIVGGSLFKIAQLSGGGTTVAENVGGRRIMPNTTDPVERRLVNVVEEMALASGVPVPPIYLLPEEQGINAFAAGYSPSDAVVAVTRGTAEQLTRDQLQGVVAHEFSHILNGDMRLNIRLIGVLHGILLMGLIGRLLFRIAAHTSNSRSKNNPAIAFLLIGVVTIVLGYVGTLIGNLIKAAVSRQREYLADASAVQFTRNPEGISGALKRIGASVFGSKIKHPNATEMSHMYFGQGVWEGFTGLMATHPPLPKRIRALEPSWDGKFPALPDRPSAFMETEVAAGFVGDAHLEQTVPMAVVAHAADQVGQPSEVHNLYAQKLVDELPSFILEAVHEPYGARAVIFALLLDQDPAIRQTQMQKLDETTSRDIVELTRKLSPAIDELDARVRLPLVDMSLSSLRAMVKPQYQEFSRAFQELVKADNRLSLFEWMLHRVLLRHLRPQFDNAATPPIAYYGLQRLSQPCATLLSALARAGNSSAEAEVAFTAAVKHLPELNMELLPVEQCNLMQLESALNELTRVAAKHRERLIEACSAAICADKEVKVREVELLRGISDMLDCPMPPLLAGQPIGV